MAKFTKELMSFCIDAYRALRHDESERACYIKYRDKDLKCIEFIMQKESYYFGKWVVFENYSFAMTIDETLLKEWFELAENEMNARLGKINLHNSE